APQFALHESRRVLADPADRPGAEAGAFLILPRPDDRLLRGIDMGGAGARARRNKCCKTGIAEQVEHLHRTPPAADQRIHVTPMRRLFGKDADMAERSEAAKIIEPVMAHRPGLAERLAWKPPASDPLFIGIASKDC